MLATHPWACRALGMNLSYPSPLYPFILAIYHQHKASTAPEKLLISITGSGAMVIAFAQSNQVKVVWGQKTGFMELSILRCCSSKKSTQKWYFGLIWVEASFFSSYYLAIISRWYFRENMTPIRFDFFRAASWNTKLHFFHYWASLPSPRTDRL